MKIDAYELAMTIQSLRHLHGRATTEEVNTHLKQKGFTFNARRYLRALEREEVVKSSRPFEPKDLTLLWTIK